jgi:hypothetical protein
LTGTANLSAMGFGVRLGPFRVGVSGRGRARAGMSVGPFSASTGIGGRRRTPQGVAIFPGTVEQAVQAAEAEGFRVVSRRRDVVGVRRGWRDVYVRPAGPHEATMRQGLSQPVIVTLALGFVALVGLLVGLMVWLT